MSEIVKKQALSMANTITLTQAVHAPVAIKDVPEVECNKIITALVSDTLLLRGQEFEEGQPALIAANIRELNKGLKLAELVWILKRGACGMYGEVYGRVGVQDIMNWIVASREERMNEKKKIQ